MSVAGCKALHYSLADRQRDSHTTRTTVLQSHPEPSQQSSLVPVRSAHHKATFGGFHMMQN